MKSNLEKAKVLLENVTATPHYKGPLDDWDLREAQVRALISIAESLEAFVKTQVLPNPTDDR